MMKRMRDRKRGDSPKLEMTPMIDVVFQLLIFFLYSIKHEDILAHLDVSRPAPDPTTRQQSQVEDLLTITIYRDGFLLKGRQVGMATLDRHLSRLASFSKNVSVIIKCTADSPHKYLVRLLDTCAKAELSNLSVFSM